MQLDIFARNYYINATNRDRTFLEARPLGFLSRAYFIDVEDVNAFILRLDEYILFNNITDKNKYLLLKHSLKGGALLWFTKSELFF